MTRLILAAIGALLITACQTSEDDPDLVEELMRSDDAFFQPYLDSARAWEIQIMYTQIDRDTANRPSFRSYFFNADTGNYFYPASTVKLPMVLLALEKIDSLRRYGVDRSSIMLHDSVYAGQQSVRYDSTSSTGFPSIEHYARKILIVSDNDAFNRLYEFVGQKAINDALRTKGYRSRFLHRLERPLSPDENRHTEAVRFVQDDHVLWSQPGLVNPDSIRPSSVVKKGMGFMRGEKLINEPFDFTYKNYYPLAEQQEVLKAILFPEAIAPEKRFRLREDDRLFVMKYMSQWPRETSYPPYHKDPQLYDAYCKFLMYGEDREPIPPSIRIFNKVGDAYGYLIDNAYIVDFEHNVEFMLSAVINTNTDGIYNDSKYEYARLGFPFMKRLGQVVYAYERKRKRTVEPDLTPFRLEYDQSKPSNGL